MARWPTGIVGSSPGRWESPRSNHYILAHPIGGGCPDIEIFQVEQLLSAQPGFGCIHFLRSDERPLVRFSLHRYKEMDSRPRQLPGHPRCSV